MTWHQLFQVSIRINLGPCNYSCRAIRALYSTKQFWKTWFVEILCFDIYINFIPLIFFTYKLTNRNCVRTETCPPEVMKLAKCFAKLSNFRPLLNTNNDLAELNWRAVRCILRNQRIRNKIGGELGLCFHSDHNRCSRLHIRQEWWRR